MLVPLVPLGAYVAAYYHAGECVEAALVPSARPVKLRGYRHAWQRTLFEPAAWVERRLSGRDIEICEMPDPPN